MIPGSLRWNRLLYLQNSNKNIKRKALFHPFKRLPGSCLTCYPKIAARVFVKCVLLLGARPL